MVGVIILICEIGFWVAIGVGLMLRYLARRPRLGAAALLLAPVLDLVLLAATAVDLRGGATADWQHGLAAIYLGFSIVYGHRMISWADVRFAHRFAGGPPPARLAGAAYARLCWHDVARTALAAGIASGILAVLIALVADARRSAALQANFGWLAVIVAAELLFALSYTVWPRRPAEPHVPSAVR